MTAKRQQAISSHLGQVLETTEEYTRWLTEGITGAKTKRDDLLDHDESVLENTSDNNDCAGIKKKKRRLDNELIQDSKEGENISDEEFTVSILFYGRLAYSKINFY